MLQIEQWSIDRLIPYERNPRKNDHAVDKTAIAIKEFGFRVPIIAKSDGLVVDGHLRLKAAKLLGLKEVPVILADDMTNSQIKAFHVSVNKIADLADWDEEMLRLELQELTEAEYDLSVIGFSDFELEEIMGFEGFEPDEETGDGSSRDEMGLSSITFVFQTEQAEEIKDILGSKSAEEKGAVIYKLVKENQCVI